MFLNSHIQVVYVVQAGATILWDLIVGGWDVSYRSEFVLSAHGSYSTLIDKNINLSSSDEPIYNSFRASEAGKVVLIIDKSSSNKKKAQNSTYMPTTSYDRS